MFGLSTKSYRASRCISRFAVAVLLLSCGSARARADEKTPPAKRHPTVPGFERFFTAGDADSVQGGRLLLGELNCTSCHRAEASAEAVISRKQARVLDGVGNRIKRGYLRKFLSDPHSVKPGTTMPNVLAAVPAKEREEQVEALAHFLASTGSMGPDRFERKLVAAGRDLYN